MFEFLYRVMVSVMVRFVMVRRQSPLCMSECV